MTQEPADLLLDWVAGQPGALQPNVTVDTSPSAAGRRLKATCDVDAGDVLLSVPLKVVFADLEVCTACWVPCEFMGLRDLVLTSHYNIICWAV